MFLAQNKHKINILSGLILVALTLATGISVFVVMQRQAESLLSNDLRSTLKSNLRLLESQIDQTLSNTQTVTTRPNPIKNLQLLASEPNNAKVQVELQKIAQSYLQTGFTGFSFYDVRGHEVARAGHFSQQPVLRVPLKTKHRTFLLWDGQFILQASSDILDQQQRRRIGTVLTESNLPLMTAAFADIASIGKTGEFALCAPLADDEKKMDCFLSRISGKDFKRLPRVVEGKWLPMNYALNMETGILFTQDYRHEKVIAAYAPVGSLGLGIVLKQGQSELYSAVAGQLKFVALLLITLVLVGILLLHILVRPLVRNLVDSERATRQLHTELSQFKNTLDQTLDCVFMFDPESLRFTYVNKGAMQQVGYSETDLLQMTPPDLAPEFTLEQFRQLVQPLIDGVLPSLTFQTLQRHKDGHDVPVEAFLQLVRLEGQDPRFVAMVSDISERKQTEQRIAHMANHDALTDLPNRHLLQDRIQQALIHSRRNGNQGAVLFIDLDKFKVINDTMGHDVGDLLLKEVAHRLVSSLRSQDTVARTGGDEFIVVLHNVATAQDAGTMAQKLLDALLLPYRFAGKELHISASIGIAVFPDDGEDADTLLKNSDAAMYHAKETGRNNCQFFARK